MNKTKEKQKEITKQIEPRKSRLTCTNSLSFKRFYIEDLIHLIQPYALKKKNIAVFLIILSRLIVLSFLYKNEEYYTESTNNMQEEEKRIQRTASFLQYIQIYPLLEERFTTIHADYAVILPVFIFNCLFTAILVLSMLFEVLNNLKIGHYLKRFAKFYTTIYNSFIFYISLNISLVIIEEGHLTHSASLVSISYINVFLTLGTGYLIEVHDFSCSFREQSNYLAKQSDNTNIFFLLLRTALVFMSKFTSHQAIAIYSALYYLMEVMYLLLKDYYLSNYVNQLYVYLTMSSFQITLCVLLQIFFRTSSDIMLLAAVTIPLSIKLESSDRLLYEELSERHFRKEYIEHLLLDMIEKYIQNISKHKKHYNISILRLSLLNYLFEIINDPTRALINLYRIQFQQIQTNQIKGAYMFYFYQLKEQVMTSYQEVLFESNIENQRINMMGAILFDEKINICREKLRTLLVQSGTFYDFLCSDYIPLKQLEDFSVPLVNLNKEIEQTYFQLFEINPFDIDLQYLASIYIQVLDFQNRKISVFQKQALNNINLSSKKLKKMKEQYKVQQNNYFTEKTCVIYSSFLENDYIVNKVSNSFESIFRIPTDTILGKPLNILVPKIIKNSHNKMIFKFIDQESLNIVKQGERQAFALDNKGFVFPITLRMKIDTFTNDIGVCALVQRMNRQKSYILFQQDGTVTDFSKKLFIDMYQTLDSKIEISQSIFNMIPSIEAILQSSQFYTQFCSILVVKKDQIKKQNQRRELSSPTKPPSKRQYTANDDVFLIQFKVGKNTTKINVNIYYVEIDFYEKETHENKKKRIIHDLNYQSQLKEKQLNINSAIYQIPEGNNQSQYYASDKQMTQVSFYNQEFSSNKKRKPTANLNNYDDETYIQSLSNIQMSPLKIERKGNHSKTTLSNLNNITKLKNESISNLLYQQKQILEESRNEQRAYSATDIQLVSLNSSKHIQELSEYRGNITDRLDELQKGEAHYQSFRNINGLHVNTTCDAENIKNHAYESMESYSINRNIQHDQIQSNSAASRNNLDQINQIQDENVFSQNNIFSNNNLNNLEYENTNTNYILQTVKANYYNHFNQIDDESESYEESLNNNNKNRQKTQSGSSTSMNEEDEKREQRNEIASVNSSKFSSVELNKRSMIKRIQSEGFSRGQQLMIITGIIAFLTLCTVTVSMYFENQKSLDLYLDSFLKIDNAIFCFIDVLDILALSNYKDILSYRYTHIINSKEEKKAQIKEVKEISNILVLNDYLYNMKQLVLHNDSPEQIEQLQEMPFNVQKFTVGFDRDDEGYAQYIGNQTFSQNLQYTMMEFYYSIHEYAREFAEAEENFIWVNLMTFKEKMKNLQRIVEKYAQKQFDNMNTQQTSILIVISVISVILALTIIPLSIFVQVQKESIMKLLGSFQPQVLEHQIKVIELAIFKIDHIALVNETNRSMLVSMKSLTKSQRGRNNQQIKALMEQALEGKDDELTNQSGRFNQQFNNELPRYISRIQNKRNRSIASFSNLPKLSWNILIMSVVAISLLMIQPFLNIIQFKPFEREARVSLDERIAIIDISSQLIENQTPHYSNIYMFDVQEAHPYDTTYYQYIVNITESNENAIKAIPQLTQSLDVKRFKQDRFEGFYERILNGNLCEVKEKYPQYFDSNITKSTCESTFEGILKRGLLLSFKKAFETYFLLFDLYHFEELDDIYIEWVAFQERNSLIEFHTFIKVITQSVNAIRKYQNNQLQEYHDQISKDFFYLFIIQLLIISIIFMIGWTYLFSLFNSQLKLTKKIFTLFHINVLFENNFIQAYFKRTSFGRKN